MATFKIEVSQRREIFVEADGPDEAANEVLTNYDFGDGTVTTDIGGYDFEVGRVTKIED